MRDGERGPGVRDGAEDRARLLRDAVLCKLRRSGCSYRLVAGVLGMSPMGVHKRDRAIPEERRRELEAVEL